MSTARSQESKQIARPASADGRAYPAHLIAYEKLDETLLPIVETMQPVTFDELSSALSDTRARAVLPRWLASAQWRGLLKRRAAGAGAVRSYQLAGTVSRPQSRRH